MSKKSKLKEKIMQSPTRKDIRFDELHNFLINEGFVLLKSSGSSHRIYRHDDFPGIINIQSSNGLVKRYHVDDVKDAIKYIGGNKDE
jgi:predicted RNA binding protein YcfA (HicA-like mRNA interferase family)